MISTPEEDLLSSIPDQCRRTSTPEEDLLSSIPDQCRRTSYSKPISLPELIQTNSSESDICWFFPKSKSMMFDAWCSAINSKDPEIAIKHIKMLTAIGLEVNVTNDKKETPLMIACGLTQPSSRIVQQMLSLPKIKVNSTDDRGQNALMILLNAVHSIDSLQGEFFITHYEEIIIITESFLSRPDFDPNQLDFDGKTILYRICQAYISSKMTDRRMIQLMVKNKKIYLQSKKTSNCFNSFYLACRHGNKILIESLLIRPDLDINPNVIVDNVRLANPIQILFNEQCKTLSVVEKIKFLEFVVKKRPDVNLRDLNFHRLIFCIGSIRLVESILRYYGAYLVGTDMLFDILSGLCMWDPVIIHIHGLQDVTFKKENIKLIIVHLNTIVKLNFTSATINWIENTEIKNLIVEFNTNKDATIEKWQKELKEQAMKELAEENAEYVRMTFALVVSVCDGLLKIKADQHERTTRFFRIVCSLPLDLQMVLCKRTFGKMTDIIAAGPDLDDAFQKSLALF
jgi:hypothetical protein